jgi:hypothetical protein
MIFIFGKLQGLKPLQVALHRAVLFPSVPPGQQSADQRCCNKRVCWSINCWICSQRSRSPDDILNTPFIAQRQVFEAPALADGVNLLLYLAPPIEPQTSVVHLAALFPERQATVWLETLAQILDALLQHRPAAASRSVPEVAPARSTVVPVASPCRDFHAKGEQAVHGQVHCVVRLTFSR